MEELIAYRIELSFAGFPDCGELEIDAPADIDETYLLDILREEYMDDLIDMLEVYRMDKQDDDEWRVTVILTDNNDVKAVYSVYSDYEEDAEESALEEAVQDFDIEYFEPIE